MINEKIKKIGDRIYEFDFSKSELMDGNEIITTDTMSEFVMTLRKRDLDRGVIVTPSGYTKGLVYKSTNDGEFYNNPSWLPDVVNFALNIYGVKKGQFYKITVKGRDTGNNTIITTDRKLIVSNEDKELLIDEDLKGVNQTTEYYGIFRSNDNETNLLFKIGKIYITDIIIDEIDIFGDETLEVEVNETVFDEGKLRVAAYGVFTTEPIQVEAYKGRYLPMTRYSGKGLSLYFDKNTNEYILERDNREDVLNESFTNINYIVDFNFNKVVNKGYFSQYNITDVNPELSPNTLKQGFIKFEFVDDAGKAVKYGNTNSRISIIIYKLF
jgi:hypothetical protein